MKTKGKFCLRKDGRNEGKPRKKKKRNGRKIEKKKKKKSDGRL